MKYQCLVLLMLLVTGCNSEETKNANQVQSMMTVIDKDGTETQIFSSELIAPDSGKPTVDKVLVIDRFKKQKKFVDAGKLQSQNPSAPRYFPVTEEIAPGG